MTPDSGQPRYPGRFCAPFVPPVIRIQAQSLNIAIGGRRLHWDAAAEHCRFGYRAEWSNAGSMTVMRVSQVTVGAAADTTADGRCEPTLRG